MFIIGGSGLLRSFLCFRTTGFLATENRK